MTEPVIAVEALEKSYGSVRAVDAISFEVAAGEIFGVVGPNGAGKTTTIECLEGLRASEGARVALRANTRAASSSCGRCQGPSGLAWLRDRSRRALDA